MGEVGAVDDMLTTHDFQTWWARNTPLKTTVCVHRARGIVRQRSLGHRLAAHGSAARALGNQLPLAV